MDDPWSRQRFELLVLVCMGVFVLGYMGEIIVNGLDLVQRAHYLGYVPSLALLLWIGRGYSLRSTAFFDRARVPILCAIVVFITVLNIFVSTGPHAIDVDGWIIMGCCEPMLLWVGITPFLPARWRLPAPARE